MLDASREAKTEIVAYTFGTRVVSSLELRDFRLGWAYQFINVADRKFRLGTFLQGHGLWLKAALAAPNLSPPISESDRLTVGLPMIGLAMDIHPHPRMNISGDFSGLKAGKYGYAVDGELSLKMAPVRHLGLVAGYRSFRLNPKVGPDFAVVRISGLFIGAFARLGSLE